jgi:chitinase
VDDTLIAERKAGLEAYLSQLVQSPQYRDNEVLQEFLSLSLQASPRQFDPEDALPSTLSRKKAEELLNDVSTAATFIAAAYYPDWSANSFPPERLDYSKFDILFFGMYALVQ